MTRRIVWGGSGSNFKFRASLAGVNAETAPLGNGNYQVHEAMRPMAADHSGSVTLAAGANTSINIGTDYTKNPTQVLLNADDGLAMGTEIRAEYVIATGILTIFNDGTTSKTIRYAVLIDY